MEQIIVVDFGSQSNQVIVKALRKQNVFAELVNYELVNVDYVKRKNIKGIILSGGPSSVYDELSYKIDPAFFDLDIPILGVCYGMQYIANYFGLEVETKYGEFGSTEMTLVTSDPLVADLPNTFNVWMNHNDSVLKSNEQMIVIGKTERCIALIKHKTKNIYGTQFHLELEQTEHGQEMIANFLKLCGVEQDFTMQKYINSISEQLRETVGDKKIICALSGGVDSTVVATLLAQLFPEQVYYFFVDTGLLRAHEADEVMLSFKRLNINVQKVEISDVMFTALQGITDPEEKRKIIGKVFIDTFRSELHEIAANDNVEFLAQGTLYSDVIESGTKTSHTIKSHHNVGGLPEDLDFTLLEPVRTLFKDEVRELGLVLNLSHDFVYRQPFPGPGLGIRIIGEVTKEKVATLQQADLIMRDIIKEEGLNEEIWQYFCVLTNTKSVGIKGDMRVYNYVLALRMVTSSDGISADFARVDFNVLAKISTAITNNCSDIVRVVYDITSKPPGTIEWE